MRERVWWWIIVGGSGQSIRKRIYKEFGLVERGWGIFNVIRNRKWTQCPRVTGSSGGTYKEVRQESFFPPLGRFYV